MIEVERKYRLDPAGVAAVRDHIHANCTQLRNVRQVDQVFLHQTTSFRDFVRGDPVVRLRTVDGDTELAVKRAITPEGDTVEHEVSVGSAHLMARALTEMGYHEVVTVQKWRLSGVAHGLAIALDSVDGLGDFVEIEMLLAETRGMEAAADRIETMATALGLSSAVVEPRKYDELLQDRSPGAGRGTSRLPGAD